MRVIVCGGRDYDDHVRLFQALNKFHVQKGITLVIEGGATGADENARIWAESAGVTCVTCHANWHKQKKAAGPIRNQDMIDKLSPDCVIAFPGGSGTADMVNRAKAANINVWEVKG